MDSTDLVDRLTAHTTLGGVPRRELEWLASHGTLRRLKEGDTLAVKDEPVAGLFVVLSGRFAIFRDAGAGGCRAKPATPAHAAAPRQASCAR